MTENRRLLQIDGKRIIVTGGARGMGSSAVRAFVAEGGHVASFDVMDDLGRKVAAEAGKSGPGTVRFYHCDISKKSEVDDVFKSAVGDLGGLDALVNAAGIDRAAKAEEITEEQWNEVFQVNVLGTLFTNQAAFHHMRDHGGRIINFGSGAGMRGSAGVSHYAASKGAVIAWTRSVAQEWGKYGITVNAMAPAIWTPMYNEYRARMTPEELKAHDAKFATEIPMGGKLGDPDRDLAPVLVFLVSDGSRFVTRQTIVVNGGLYEGR